MPIPEVIPHIEPTIPKGVVFVAITTTDPSLPMFIVGWHTELRDFPKAQPRPNPVTDFAVREFYDRSGFERDFNGARLKSWRVILHKDIPKDRTYRDAWEDVAGAVAHNINKAREIHKQHIRVARIARMQELDVEYLRANEENDVKKAEKIVATKKILRDLPDDPRIEMAQTVAELKEIWPNELQGK